MLYFLLGYGLAVFLVLIFSPKSLNIGVMAPKGGTPLVRDSVNRIKAKIVSLFVVILLVLVSFGLYGNPIINKQTFLAVFGIGFIISIFIQFR